MSFSRRPKKTLMNQINVVPYIDVMLVLLVIFMVTAPIMNPGQVELPQVGSSTAPPIAPIEVMIKKDLTVVVRDHAEGGREQRVTEDELVLILRDKQQLHSEQAVVISADKNVRYEEVIKIMDLLQQQQIKKIGLLTEARK